MHRFSGIFTFNERFDQNICVFSTFLNMQVWWFEGRGSQQLQIIAFSNVGFEVKHNAFLTIS